MPTRVTSRAGQRAAVAHLQNYRKKEGGRGKGSHAPIPSSFFSEADLSCLWRDQTYPPEALITTGGETLRVIYRGLAGTGRGPDFRAAVIAAPGGLLRGDVELHVRSSDFRRHGHERDPAYGGVVLHLVFEDDDEGRPTPLAGGGSAPVVALAGWARARAAEIGRWLERPALWREPCFSSLRQSGAPAVGATLDRLGDMRFRRKAASFAARLREAADEEVLWGAMLEALAYGSAREAFRALAERLPWARLRARLAPLPPTSRAAAAWRLLDAAAQGLALPAGARRPADSPQRRLKGAAQLAARFAQTGLISAFAAAIDGRGQDARGVGAKVSHFEFRPAAPSRLASRTTNALTDTLIVPGLIGRARALEVLANAVLPCLAALGPEGRARRAESAFGGLPLPARYGAVRHLHEAVGGAVPVNFRRQQGMLYLLRQYCTQGGCGRCPLS